jgi:hypothetical protein
MDAHWEQASRRARGAYLVVLPDRWVMRGGTLKLLASLVECESPQCVFWDTKLAMQKDGRHVRPFGGEGPVQYEVLKSGDLLEQLLRFQGYIDDTVFTQPFPRSLNSIIRVSLANAIRERLGVFYAPNACDYTSGITTLLNVGEIVHLRESLYLAIGAESNGQQLSIHGVPDRLRAATHWRGLALDTVLLTVMNDLEKTFERNAANTWISRFNMRNVLLCLLNEIHFKEWHGTPLDTRTMRLELIEYARRNERQIGPGTVDALRAYDKLHAPRLRSARRLLQRAGVFYTLYEWKHAVLGRKVPESTFRYSDDLLSARRIQMIDPVHS